MGITRGQLITWTAPLVIVLMPPMPARAFDLSGGLNFGDAKRAPFRASRF